MEKEKKNREDKVGLGKLLLWQSREVAKTPAFLMLTFLMVYCTDTLKIPAATVSIILIVSKLVDGVTDMAAGFIVDRTQTKWGKGRPVALYMAAILLSGKYKYGYEMRLDICHVCNGKFYLSDIFEC